MIYILYSKGSVSKGFTLVELLVVLAIIGLLAGAIILVSNRVLNKTKVTSDIATVKSLNTATLIYKTIMNSNSSDAFYGLNNDIDRIHALVVNEDIASMPISSVKGNVFIWSIPEQKWSAVYLVGGTDATMVDSGGFKGYITGSYSGDGHDIKIPSTINGTAVTRIYQDVFSGKELTSVVIEEGVTRIHARAFKDNNLTEIVLPNSITRLDYGAFMNSGLTKVTIGSGVYLEGNVFPNNDSFTAAYNIGGAGTYVLSGGIWTKR